MVIDAHRGEVYAAVYDGAGNAIVPEVVLQFEKLLALIGDLPVEWISQAPLPVTSEIVFSCSSCAFISRTLASTTCKTHVSLTV